MIGSSWSSREAAWFGSVVASTRPPWNGCSTSSRGGRDRPAGRCPCLPGSGTDLALQLQRWGSLPVNQDLGEDAMSGVAIEDLLELWSAELRKAKAKLSWLIDHPSVVASAAAFLDTLLGAERRKTGWMRAEAAGDTGPWRQQAVLGRSHWDADALRDYALETLAEA